MKSTLIETIEFKTMDLNPELFIIEVPSWGAVTQPLKEYALAQYQRQSGQVVKELTDDILQQVEDIPVDTVTDFEMMGIEVYKNSQAQHHFYNQILPAILSEYSLKSDVTIDEEELEEYIEDYMEKVEGYAASYEMNLSDYGEKVMGIEGDAEAEFHKRAKEDFVFKIIAVDHFEEIGGSTDELAYEEFIQQNVLQNQADPIELKSRLPYDVFKIMMPEMHLSQEIYDYYFPQIKFEINPEAPLQFNQ